MLEHVILSSLITIGIYIACWPGFVLERPRALAQRVMDRVFGKYSEYLQRPLFGCPMCMSSFWTIMIAITYKWFTIIELPIAILAVCAINALIISAIKDLLP